MNNKKRIKLPISLDKNILSCWCKIQHLIPPSTNKIVKRFPNSSFIFSYVFHDKTIYSKKSLFFISPLFIYLFYPSFLSPSTTKLTKPRRKIYMAMKIFSVMSPPHHSHQGQKFKRTEQRNSPNNASKRVANNQKGGLDPHLPSPSSNPSTKTGILTQYDVPECIPNQPICTRFTIFVHSCYHTIESSSMTVQ